MTYRFDIEDLGAGRHRFHCAGHVADSERALARKLVNAGLPDGPIEAGRTIRTAWTARSLHRLAATTLSEGDRGFTHGIYAPNPRFNPEPMHPALERAVAVLRDERISASGGVAATPLPGEGEKPLAVPHDAIEAMEAG